MRNFPTQPTKISLIETENSMPKEFQWYGEIYHVGGIEPILSPTSVAGFGRVQFHLVRTTDGGPIFTMFPFCDEWYVNDMTHRPY